MGMKKGLFYVLLCLVSVILVCCMNIANGKHVELMPAVSAPKNYPARLIQGAFILPNGDMCSLRGSFATRVGWGKEDGGVSWSASRRTSIKRFGLLRLLALTFASGRI